MRQICVKHVRTNQFFNYDKMSLSEIEQELKKGYYSCYPVLTVAKMLDYGYPIQTSKFYSIGSAKAGEWKEQSTFFVEFRAAHDYIDYSKKIDCHSFFCNNTDNGLFETINICKLHGIVPAFCYYTYSHNRFAQSKDNIKVYRIENYCLAFVCDGIINSMETREAVVQDFMTLFPNCLKKSLEPDNIVRGTDKGIIMIDPAARFSPEHLHRHANNFKILGEEYRNILRREKREAQKNVY